MVLSSFFCNFAPLFTLNFYMNTPIDVIHFVLDAFVHFMPEREVRDFVRRSVGKWVFLIPNDENEADHFCVDGIIDGWPCCHVSAKKAPLVREAIERSGQPGLTVKVLSDNLDKGYATLFCEIKLEKSIEADFMKDRLEAFRTWEYDGEVAALNGEQRRFVGNTQFLLQRLMAADATEEDLLPVVDAYIKMMPMALSKEDKESYHRVNVMLQESRFGVIRERNRQVVEVLDFLNHPEQRRDRISVWLNELMCNDHIVHAADGLDGDGLERLRGQLGRFPDKLFETYERNYDVFCANLFYNDIPRRNMQMFMSGLAEYRIAKERLERLERDRRVVRPLPSMVVSGVRKDAELNELLRGALESIMKQTGKRNVKWKWSHVKKVLEDDCIIYKVSPTEFGRQMNEINSDIDADNCRKNIENNELGVAERGRYIDLPASCGAKAVMMAIGEKLKMLRERMSEKILQQE